MISDASPSLSPSHEVDRRTRSRKGRYDLSGHRTWDLPAFLTQFGILVLVKLALWAFFAYWAYRLATGGMPLPGA